MILTPAQNTIAEDTHRFRVVNCGRRFGKTTLATEEMLGVALAKKDRRVTYYAPTIEDARDIMWGSLVRICEPVIIYKNDSRLELRIRSVDGGESLISINGWESVQERGKGRGLANDFIVFDEVAQYRNFWVGWDEVLSPTLIDRKGSALFISTPKGFNHFYELYNLQEKDENYKSFHFTTYDNPHVPQEEIERERLSKTEDRFAQEYLADFRKTEGLVYKTFSRDKHVYTDADYTVAETLAGIDWGWTNPTAAHKVEKDTQRHYWISDEFYKTNKTTGETIEHVKTYGASKVYADPAEPDRNEEARKAGLNIREVSKDIEAGISCVQDLFKQGRIHIHSSCVNLIRELETYSYPEKKADKNEPELPIKENDHALDEIRYVLYMQEGKGGTTYATVHYAASAQPRPTPQTLAPELQDVPRKVAYTHVPRL